MYENGKRLNKHAKNEIHRKERKRKFTPIQYSSYETFVEHMEDLEPYNACSERHAVENGRAPWYCRWWHDVHGFVRRSPLKEDAHSKERAHYRDELAHYDIEEDDMDMPKKFSDPWCWD